MASSSSRPAFSKGPLIVIGSFALGLAMIWFAFLKPKDTAAKATPLPVKTPPSASSTPRPSSSATTKPAGSVEPGGSVSPGTSSQPGGEVQETFQIYEVKNP